MEEVSYENRHHIETVSEDKKYNVTTLVKVQRKKVLTNSDIERRKSLKKFGQAAGYEKGSIENSIAVDDKEVFLLPFGEEKNEDSISKFVTTRNHRERFGQLEKKEKEIKEGKLENNRPKSQFVTESSSNSIKISNLPLSLSQAELEDFLSGAVRPRKIYRPLGREDRIPRDFALIQYTSKAEADEAILRYNNKPCGSQILTAEMADRGNPPNKPPSSRPFSKYRQN